MTEGEARWTRGCGYSRAQFVTDEAPKQYQRACLACLHRRGTIFLDGGGFNGEGSRR
jgi:hypothetical protein